MKKTNNWKNFVIGTGVVAFLSAAGIGLIDYIDRTYILKKEDFTKANWEQFYNDNGRIWSCYMNETIPHNQNNWDLYNKEVLKKNNGKLGGNVLLPDLDNDEIVGK